MSFTTPKTMAAGTTGTSADWNTYIRDNTNAVANRAFVAQSSTARVIISGVYQNTTPGALIVSCTYQTSSLSTPQSVGIGARIGSISTALNYCAINIVPQEASTNATASMACVTFVVPQNWWYNLQNNGSAPGVFNSWSEWSIS